MKALISILLVFTALTSFSQVRFSATNGEAIEMKRSNSDKEKQKSTKVFFVQSDVPDDMEQIGILTVKEKDRAVAVEKAKIYGSRATGDAVLLVDAKDQTAGQAVAKFFIGGSSFKGKYVFLVYRSRKQK